MHGRSTRGSRRSWRDELYGTLLCAGRDLEERADGVRRTLARALRRIAPSVVHAGAQLAHDMRAAARLIDARLLREGKPPSLP